ncbi:outer membrane beta-barrel protein [Thalassotalea euphylliae]|uniref:DUF560 domain-containing protein n=1 Tax=Thalassotalea euphylliae TaxID=1655234 RepID=A0A3E0UAY4_9GAMM|nr:outer membrane beta-barrel protein [Thalassotalea euphylliae]REL34096.1 hypothetical protein DXX92_01335 [Thalassotalea euphylliae]
MQYLYSFLAISLIASFPAFAESVKRTDSNFNFPFVEGNQLDIELGLETDHIDNFLNQKQDKQSTTAYALSAHGFAQFHDDDHLLQSYANIDTKFFDNFEEDDHTDVTLLGKYFYRLMPAHRLLISSSFDKRYEYRGTGLSRGIANTFSKGDTKENTLVNLGYQIGNLNSVSRFNAIIGSEQSEYSTRRAVTNIYDYQRLFTQLDLDYLITGKSYLAFDLGFNDFAYDNNRASDRTEARALVGAKWSPNQASSLAILLGYQAVDFESLDRKEQDFAWQGSYDWRPTERFRLSLITARKSEVENEQESEAKITDTYQASLTYLFNERWQFNTLVQFERKDTLLRNASRLDKELQLSSSVSYQLNSSFTIVGRYQYIESNSDFSPFDYERQQLGVSLSYDL